MCCHVVKYNVSECSKIKASGASLSSDETLIIPPKYIRAQSELYNFSITPFPYFSCSKSNETNLNLMKQSIKLKTVKMPA